MAKCWSKFCFFFCHSIIHVFGYIIPRLWRLLGGLLICKPFRKNQQESEGFIWHPETQVRVIHHVEQLEPCVSVFGLMDVANSVLEDRQFCWPTEDPEERKRLMKEAESKMLKYTSPLYSGHITTIMGCFRPSDELEYERESMTAWDGCPVMLDWLYADGEAPLCRGRNLYSHLTCENEMDYAPVLQEDGTLLPPSLPPGVEDVDDDDELLHGSDHASSFAPRTQHEPLDDEEDELSTPSEGRRASRTGADRDDHATTTGVPVGSEVKKARGLVIIFPGLSSYSHTNYIKSFARALHRQGYHVCVLNVRGNGDTPLTTPFIFNGAYTRDTRDAMRLMFSKKALVRRFGRTMPVLGLGLSIGGAMLSKYLGEQGRAGAECHLDAAFTVCAPNDFLHMVEHMNRGTYQKNIYQDDMCSDIRNYILRHRALHMLPNVDNDWVARNIHRFTRVIHFDQHVLAKSTGYRSIHHYHIDTSAITWVPYSPVPLLVLSSFDDPVIGRSAMPHRWKEITQSNPRVVYVESHPGGHLGFLGGPVDELMGRDNWMERFTIQRMAAAVEYWEAVQREPKRHCSGLMANCQHLELSPSEYQRRVGLVQRRGKPFVVDFQDTVRRNGHSDDSGADTVDSYDISDLKYNMPPRPDRLSNRCYFLHPTVAVVRPAPSERLLHNFFDTRDQLGISLAGHRGLPREEISQIVEYAEASREGSPQQPALRLSKAPLAPPTPAVTQAPTAKSVPFLVDDSTPGYSSSTTGAMPSSYSTRLPPRRRSTVQGCTDSSTTLPHPMKHRTHPQLPLSSSSGDNSHGRDSLNQALNTSDTSAFSDDVIHRGVATRADDEDDVRVSNVDGRPWLAAWSESTGTAGVCFTNAPSPNHVSSEWDGYESEVEDEKSADHYPAPFESAAHERRVNRFARENTNLFNEQYGFRSGKKPFNDYNMTSMEEERLPRHVPVVTNADYFVDPRAYMDKNL